MNIKELNEFMYLCRRAGFATLGEVNSYMKAHGINCREFFNELKSSNVCINGVFATTKEFREFERMLRLGFIYATIECCNGMVYFKTL